MSDPAIELVGLSKRYGGDLAVDHLDLEIPEGAFFALLGPSGCGKTTTLRMVGGFEKPTAGRVHLAGRDVSGRPPHRRSVNTVFQSYALFPHLDVDANVAFGLRRAGVQRRRARERVQEILGVCQLEGLGARKPQELSGGQQQRVALARALVNRPAALLLDEPLGALDLRLRRQLQEQIKRIQHEVGITFVHVTHDQEEAMSMADRIAVMHDGRILQIGSARELYERPATRFVAGFLGSCNFLSGDRFGEHGRVLGVRPENVRLGAPAAGDVSLRGYISASTYLGATVKHDVAVEDGDTIAALTPSCDGSAVHAAGEAVTVTWRRSDSFVLDG